MWALEMIDVGKRFGDHWVFTHLDLQIKKGESVALFGRNGSGKSTLLKMAATLLAPSFGRLQVLGHDVAKDRGEIRKKIRLLTHEKQLYGSLTVMENLKLAAGLRGRQRDHNHRDPTTVLDAIVESVKLGSFRHRRVMHLSEGLKKRVMLARLLVAQEEAEFFLLDEPHLTLDEEGKEILDRFIRIWREGGKTILIASHDHERMLSFVDRTLWVQEGRVAETRSEKRPS